MRDKALAEREQTDVEYRVAVAYTVPIEVIVDLQEGTVVRAVAIHEGIALDRDEGAPQESTLHPDPERRRQARDRDRRGRRVAGLGARLLMGEEFRLKGEPAELGHRLEESFGCLDGLSGADDLNRVLYELQGAAVLERPESLEILVYPSAVAESDVALITVFSTADPNAHVVAASEEIRKLADRALWEGSDLAALTVSIVEGAIGLANGAIAAVRDLEQRGSRRAVTAPARCPRCGAEDSLRFEYRFDLLGVSCDGAPVLSEGGELTDTFCLACCEEVDDFLGPDGRVRVAAGGEQRA